MNGNGWADIATRQDLYVLRSDLDILARELRSEMQALEGRLAERIADQSRSLFRAFVITNAIMIIAVATLAFGAARLI